MNNFRMTLLCVAALGIFAANGVGASDTFIPRMEDIETTRNQTAAEDSSKVIVENTLEHLKLVLEASRAEALNAGPNAESEIKARESLLKKQINEGKYSVADAMVEELLFLTEYIPAQKKEFGLLSGRLIEDSSASFLHALMTITFLEQFLIENSERNALYMQILLETKAWGRGFKRVLAKRNPQTAPSVVMARYYAKRIQSIIDRIASSPKKGTYEHVGRIGSVDSGAVYVNTESGVFAAHVSTTSNKSYTCTFNEFGAVKRGVHDGSGFSMFFTDEHLIIMPNGHVSSFSRYSGFCGVGAAPFSTFKFKSSRIPVDNPARLVSEESSIFIDLLKKAEKGGAEDHLMLFEYLTARAIEEKRVESQAFLSGYENELFLRTALFNLERSALTGSRRAQSLIQIMNERTAGRQQTPEPEMFAEYLRVSREIK